MKTTMRGKLLPLPSDKEKKKLAQNRITTLYSDAGFTPEQIAEKTGDTVAAVNRVLRRAHLLPEETPV